MRRSSLPYEPKEAEDMRRMLDVSNLPLMVVVACHCLLFAFEFGNGMYNVHTFSLSMFPLVSLLLLIQHSIILVEEAKDNLEIIH